MYSLGWDTTQSQHEQYSIINFYGFIQITVSIKEMGKIWKSVGEFEGINCILRCCRECYIQERLLCIQIGPI